jgi:hypothetical protein
LCSHPGVKKVVTSKPDKYRSRPTTSMFLSVDSGKLII